jgi:hypothetical protein
MGRSGEGSPARISVGVSEVPLRGDLDDPVHEPLEAVSGGFRGVYERTAAAERRHGVELEYVRISALVDTDVDSPVITGLAGAECRARELLDPLRESRRQRCGTQLLWLVGPAVIFVAMGNEAEISVAEAEFHTDHRLDDVRSPNLTPACRIALARVGLRWSEKRYKPHLRTLSHAACRRWG